METMSDEVNHETSPFAILPEGCVANIISLTSPKDACRAAAVSLGFNSAADSDTVWERFLPPNYQEIVERASSPLQFSNKKHIYFLLHNSTTPLLLDGGNLSFKLYKSGEKSYVLSARALQIASADDPQHWEWTSLPESRFAEVAKLLSINRLEIHGVIPARMLSPNTKYATWLIYKPYTMWCCGLDYPLKASVKFVKEDGTEMVGETIKIYIESPKQRYAAEGRCTMIIDGRQPWSFSNDWDWIELGEFFIGEGARYDVHIQVSETERLNQKEGIIIEGIQLVPSLGPLVADLSVFLREWS